ncbi:MAG TPA: cyclase family protein [Synergistaceae bacterium]|nr:cyclase family protein [Synergistaceae bacterium]
MRGRLLGVVVVLLLTAYIVPVAAAAEPTLLEIYQVLQKKEFVDLTHSFAPGIPHWPGFPNERRETIYWYDEGVGSAGYGFFAHVYTHVGQWGTHCDPPAHFIKDLRTIDQISVKEMLLPLVVLDIHEKAAQNPDYVVTINDVRTWENRNGSIPEGSFVVLRTDWSKRWPDVAAMRNADKDGVAHYPGWSLEVLKYLCEERKITASGHETTDTDPGIATSKGDYSCETYILSQDRYQIELLANLDKVPEYGALVVVAFPKPAHGSGFPARVFAILP